MTGAENKNRTLGEFLWGGVIEIKRRRSKPKNEPDTAGKTGPPARPPLLRYPEGERPIERGPNHVWR
jgi:hypothetical protein